jgi:hypothetical protein
MCLLAVIAELYKTLPGKMARGSCMTGCAPTSPIVPPRAALGDWPCGDRAPLRHAFESAVTPSGANVEPPSPSESSRIPRRRGSLRETSSVGSSRSRENPSAARSAARRSGETLSRSTRSALARCETPYSSSTRWTRAARRDDGSVDHRGATSWLEERLTNARFADERSSARRSRAARYLASAATTFLLTGSLLTVPLAHESVSAV